MHPELLATVLHLRFLRWSFPQIAKGTGLDIDTIARTVRQHRAELTTLRAGMLEEELDKLGGDLPSQALQNASLLVKLREEAAKRDFSKVPTEQLIRMIRLTEKNFCRILEQLDKISHPYENPKPKPEPKKPSFDPYRDGYPPFTEEEVTEAYPIAEPRRPSPPSRKAQHPPDNHNESQLENDREKENDEVSQSPPSLVAGQEDHGNPSASVHQFSGEIENRPILNPAQTPLLNSGFQIRSSGEGTDPSGAEQLHPHSPPVNLAAHSQLDPPHAAKVTQDSQ